MKTRMTSLDIRAMVTSCRQSLLGLRVANVYDINAKVYVIKLAKADCKVFLLMESGIRFHTTKYGRDKSNVPSGFTMKLRKHIRTRRLEDIKQLGIDRVIDFTFGSGENCHHVLLELYAAGNLILTDANYNILTLLRTHKFEEDVRVAVHQRYPFEHSASESTLPQLTYDQVQQVLDKDDNASSANTAAVVPSVSAEQQGSSDDEQGHLRQQQQLQQQQQQQQQQQSQQDKKKEKRKEKKKEQKTLRNVLTSAVGFIHPALAEHCFREMNVDPNQLADSSKIQLIIEASKHAERIMELAASTVLPGYITYRKVVHSLGKQSNGSKQKAGNKEDVTDKAKPESKNESAELELYEEFHCIDYLQFASTDKKTFPTFDEAVDEFFSKAETQKSEERAVQREQEIWKRLNRIKADQSARVNRLVGEQENTVLCAQLIECNLKEVDQAIAILRQSLATGVDWKELWKMIKEEKKKGNPIANMIHQLKLDSNQVTLLLDNNLAEGSEDDMTQPMNRVDVEISLSAHANAEKYYETKKKSAVKAQKTVEQAAQALKVAEKKARQEVKQEQIRFGIQRLRKVYWFEKFNWFISSENYLVISGRDAQQNEQLVKKHLNKGDIYVHADLNGASSVVIQNPSGAPVSPATLEEAGAMAVCRSAAWDAKVVTSAWWVFDHQVSKTAPTGEYLVTGSFMIRGRKNFLPPTKLEMGFAILFRIDESSLVNHLNERRPRMLQYDDETVNVEKERRAKTRADPADDPADLTAVDDEEISTVDDTVATANQRRVDESIRILREREKKYGANTDTSAIADSASKRLVNRVEGGDSNEEEKDSNDDDEDDTANVSEQARPHAGRQKLPVLSQQNSVDSADKGRNGRRPLTAKERREMKKQKKSGGVGSKNIEEEDDKTKGDQEQDGEEENKNEKEREEIGGKPAKKQKALVVPRGKKNKIKKIKEKYGEQDEEERQVKLELLGAKPVKEMDILLGADVDAEEEAADSESTLQVAQADPTAKDVASENIQASVDDSEKVCFKCGEKGHLARGCTNKRQKVTQREEAAEVKEILRQENLLQEEDKEKLTDLDTLTGQPLPDDVLLYAVPVCAPYSTLLSYKFKIKLTPGSLKKGKAAKMAVQVFSSFAEISVREKELVKNMDDTELIQTMMGNVKLSTPGLLKMKTQNKSDKKRERKAQMA